MQRRMATLPTVARLTRSRDYCKAFEAILGSRDQNIITALPDDTLGYVFNLLEDAGGSAILAMLAGDVVHLAALVPASGVGLVGAAEDGGVAEVYPALRVDMFFELLGQGGPLVVRQTAARLIEQAPVPEAGSPR